MEEPDIEQTFKAAFGASIVELEGAEHVAVRDLYGALWINHNDPRKQVKALIACLGESAWKWSRYEGCCNNSSEYKEMASAFANHISSTAYALFRREQRAQMLPRCPYWQFRAAPGFSPDKCMAADGTIRHYTDPFWVTHLPPCGRVRCQCDVYAMSESAVARLRKRL